MRPILYALLLLAAAPALAQTSPSIASSDMPVATDTLRVSAAAPVLPAGATALSVRGANQTWNYAGLTATSQRVDRYVAVSTLAASYQLSFGALGGNNRATVASPEELPLPSTGLPVTITNPYQFYNASTADFRSVGYGGTTGGIALPVTYQSRTQQDIIYRFPLRYGSLADSSNSFFSISVPGTGYLSQKRKRVNKMDAWGTLTTPFGTFQAVRVVTRLFDHDSIAFAGLPGQGITPLPRRQYKWLAKQQHIPLLTITTQDVGGRETITGIEYRDTYRRIVRLGTAAGPADALLAAYPNPSTVGTPLVLALPAGSRETSVSATDLAGRCLFRQQLKAGNDVAVLEAALFGNFRGVVLLTVTTEQGTTTRRVVRQ